MPNRYLRESYRESEAISAIGFHAECVWVRLLVTVDDWGRCEANLRILRPKLFPLRLDQVSEADLQCWLAECENAGLVRLYQREGKAYLQMMKWEVGRAKESKWPPPPPEVESICYRLQTNVCSREQTKTNPPTPIPTPTPIASAFTENAAPAPLANQNGHTLHASRVAPSDLFDADMPTVEEVIAFGAGATPVIPEDFCRHQHAKHSEEHRWLVSGRLIDWRAKFRRYWSQDRANWGKGRSNGYSIPVPVVVKPIRKPQGCEE